MEIDYRNIKVLGFDADDTLWVNETYFRDAEKRFAALLDRYETRNTIDQELFKLEMDNLPLYGYGIKGFTLSMVEAALRLSGGAVSPQVLEEILEMGKRMIDHPVELLDGVVDTLRKLGPNYRMVVLTKGDLLDQERKLERSGLSAYFHHVEVLSDKKPENYRKLLEHLEIPYSEFLMVGNSLKSDVLPILEIGAQAIHVPFHTTWAHEEVRVDATTKRRYQEIDAFTDLLTYLKN